MKPCVYVTSDIHGQADLSDALLTDYDPVEHQLVLVGDLNDRGPDSKACFLKGKGLVEQRGAVCLRGNHEEYFLQFLQNPENWFAGYVRNGGKETIEGLLHLGVTAKYSPAEMTLMIRSHYPELVDFLTKRLLYFEWQHYLFMHAGVDLTMEDWRQAALKDFLWICEPFHQGKDNADKIIAFGYTIAPMLHGDMQTTDPWQSDGKIGIDGGAIFGDSVRGVIFDERGIVQDIEYQKRTPTWQPEF